MRNLLNRRLHFRTAWDLSSNTITQYKCNDDLATTAVIDTGSAATNGTSSTNTSNLSVTGKINDAFEFTSASSETVNINKTYQAEIRAGFSVALWLKLDDGFVSADIPWGVNDGGDDATNIYLPGAGKVRFYVRVDGSNCFALTNAAVYPDSPTDWAYLVFTVSATQILIYVNGTSVTLDGTQDGDMTSAGVTLGNYTSAINLALGSNNASGTPGQFIDGVIDDYMFIDRVMTQDEVNGKWNGGSGTEAQSG